MTELKDAPVFTARDTKLSNDKKVFTVDLEVENNEQKEWLLRKATLGDRLLENAMENPVEASVSLACNGKGEVYVKNTTTLFTINTTTDICRLNNDEVQQLVDYLIDYTYQMGIPTPRWLEEMATPSIDAPSLNLSDLHSAISSNVFVPIDMRLACDLITDETLTRAIMERSNINQEVAASNRTSEEFLISEAIEKSVSEIEKATLYIQVNDDLTIDAVVEFSPYIEGDYSTVSNVGLRLTDKEKEQILEAASRQKASVLSRIEEFKKDWAYLPAPLGEERLLERERFPENDKPVPEKKPSRHRDDMER